MPSIITAKDSITVKSLVLFALLYTMYFAQSLLVPLVVTFLLALLLSPMVAFFKRMHIPRGISAVLLVSVLLTPFSFLGIQLAEPVQKWAQLLPELSEQLSEQIESINHVIQGNPQDSTQEVEAETKSGFSFFGLFEEEKIAAPPPPENMVSERIKQGGLEVLLSMLAAAPLVIAQLMTGMVLILFLLIFGPQLFQTYVSNMSKVEDKHQLIRLVGAIQSELSRYIVTISVINIGLGACTALSLKLLAIEDALLWGVLAALLNFIPYVGSLIGIGILSLAGLTQFGMNIAAFIPPAVYLLLNLIESQFVTPTILGRNMRLNPLIVVLWLIIWGWLWGAIGVLIAVPLLVCIKLIIDQLGVAPQWVAIMESEG